MEACIFEEINNRKKKNNKEMVIVPEADSVG
jgi:hypothetical protein